MNWQNTLGTLYCILHLGTSSLFNVRHLTPDMVKSVLSRTAKNRIEQVCTAPGVRQLAQFSGLHGGYGFYSPSVGSSYHSVFSLYHADTETNKKMTHPGLRYLSSKIRYRSLLDISGGWVSQDEPVDTVTVRPLAKDLAACICRQVAIRHSGWQVSCTYMVRIVSPRQHIILFETQTLHHAYHEAPIYKKSPWSTAFTKRHRPVACRRDDESVA